MHNVPKEKLCMVLVYLDKKVEKEKESLPLLLLFGLLGYEKEKLELSCFRVLMKR